MSFSDGQVYRNVLGLMVSIVDGVSTDTRVASTATKPFQSLQPLRTPMRESSDQPTPTPTTPTTVLSRRLDIALAVSQAFDETLVQLAQELRGTKNKATPYNNNRGGHRGSRREGPAGGAPRLAQSAIACASAAGLYMDACDTIAACLLHVFRCLIEDPGGEHGHAKVGGDTFSVPFKSRGGIPVGQNVFWPTSLQLFHDSRGTRNRGITQALIIPCFDSY